MNSSVAKTALLSYCRFARQYHYVATEVAIAGGMADVLASDGINLVEYEIKTDIRDLVKDKDKPKHVLYDPDPIKWEGNIGTKSDIRIELRQGERTWEPEKWSAVLVKDGEESSITGWHMKETIEEARQVAESVYGNSKKAPNTLYYVVTEPLWEKHEEKILLSLHPSYGIMTFKTVNHHELVVRRKAKKLHKNNVSKQILDTIVARMSSELAALTNVFYNHTVGFTEFGERLQKEFNLEEE